MFSMPDDLKENMNIMGKCFKQNETSGTVISAETREPISESFQAWQQLLEIIVYVFLNVFTDRLTSRAVGNHGTELQLHVVTLRSLGNSLSLLGTQAKQRLVALTQKKCFRSGQPEADWWFDRSCFNIGLSMRGKEKKGSRKKDKVKCTLLPERAGRLRH